MTELTNDYIAVMQSKSETGLKEKIDALTDTVMSIMSVITKLPGVIDNQINLIYSQLNSINNSITYYENRVSGIEAKIKEYESMPKPAPVITPPPAPPTTASLAQPKEQAKPSQSALRGSILDELKTLYAKRNGTKDTE